MRRKTLAKIIIAFGVIILLGLNISIHASSMDDYNNWNSIYNTWDVGGVDDGTPLNDNIFTISKKTYIQGICNYHWNNNGIIEGTIGIVNYDTGDTIGTWPVIMTQGSGRSNVNWYAFPNIYLEPGTYKITDSSNSTWSFNSSSGYKGFVDIKGYVPKVIVGNTENGQITVDNDNPTEGETVTITVNPNQDYKLKSMAGVEYTKINNTTYTFLMPNENVTISAEFELKYEERTVTKKETNVSIAVKGKFSQNPVLSIIKTEKGDEGYDSLITLVGKNKKVIGSYDISITGGSYVGKLYLTFTVDNKYDNYKLTVYHKKADGTTETLNTVIKNGKATIEVSELSPFVLAINEDRDATPITGINVYQNIVFMIIALSVSCITVILLKKNEKNTY